MRPAPLARVARLSPASPSASSAHHPPAPAERPDEHLFVNNVRFVSMIAIVAIHSIWAWAPIVLHSDALPVRMTYLWQPFKFATFGFFMASGFLLGERIEDYHPVHYYLRRAKSILLPWLVWFLFYCGSIEVGILWRQGPPRHSSSIAYLLLAHQFLHICKNCFFGSAFWFVPILFVALAVLLLFRSHLDDVRLGAALLLISLFYSANIYGHWVHVQHTRSFFGYVFYMWLGAWCAWNPDTLKNFLARISWRPLIGAVVLTFFLALLEAKFLRARGSVEPMNSLRFSNELFSLPCVIMIAKARRRLSPRFIKVRSENFGIYLIHTSIITFIAAALVRLLPHLGPLSLWSGMPGALTLMLTVFVATYGSTLWIVKRLRAHRLTSWTVGLQGTGRRAPAVPPAALMPAAAVAEALSE